MHARQPQVLEPDPVDWRGYLRRLVEPSGPLSSSRVHQIERLWESLQDQVCRNLPPPYATATEEGEFVMTWDNGPFHFEIEVLPQGSYDWFYFDRDSGERRGEEGQFLDAFSAEMISLLRRSTAA
jgi:hypothetical protein